MVPLGCLQHLHIYIQEEVQPAGVVVALKVKNKPATSPLGNAYAIYVVIVNGQ